MKNGAMFHLPRLMPSLLIGDTACFIFIAGLQQVLNMEL